MDEQKAIDILIDLIKEQGVKIDKLDSKIIGKELFNVYSEDVEKKLTQLDDKIDRNKIDTDARLVPLEETCTTFKAIRDGFVDKSNLLEAKNDVLDQAKEESDEWRNRMEKKVDDIYVAVQGFLTLFTLAKNNLANLVYVALFLIGVGRVGMVGTLSTQVGLERALLDTGIYCVVVLIVGIAVWIVKNRDRAEKRLYSYLHFLL